MVQMMVPVTRPALAPLCEVRSILKSVCLRPTRQRLALGRVLFADRHRHVAAEDLFRDVVVSGEPLSLATVYNTLRQFCAAGLIREVATQGGRSQYDTSAGDHHHFYVEEEDRLIDIPGETIRLDRLPAPPAGHCIVAVDVLVRLRRIPAQDGEVAA